MCSDIFLLALVCFRVHSSAAAIRGHSFEVAFLSFLGCLINDVQEYRTTLVHSVLREDPKTTTKSYHLTLIVGAVFATRIFLVVRTVVLKRDEYPSRVTSVLDDFQSVEVTNHAEVHTG